LARRSAELRREVVDEIEPVLPDEPGELAVAGHVAADELRTPVVPQVADPDRVAARPQLPHEGLADHPKSAGHQDFHIVHALAEAVLRASGAVPPGDFHRIGWIRRRLKQ